MLLGSVYLSMACNTDQESSVKQEALVDSITKLDMEEKSVDQIAFPVFVTTSIIGDWVKNVGGKRVIVENLAPPGKDPHTYQPTPKEVVKLSESKLVFSIGLTLEGKNITSLLENSLNPDSTHFPLGPKVNPIEYKKHDEHDEHDHGSLDPHFWLDPARVSIAVDEITAQLSSTDPESAAYYQENAATYKGQLSSLDKQMRSIFETIPQKDRKLVTSHEALGYLADTFGFEVIGTIIPSMTTESGPSAGEIAKLIDDLKLAEVKGIFMEDGVEEKITDQIGQDANVQVMKGLQIEYVKKGESYLQMMTTLSELISEGLK